MATITFKVDDQLKKDATELYKRMGLDISSALRMFMTQSVNLRKIPFEIKDYESVETISDEELADLIVNKMEGKRIDFNNPDDVAEFFDEEFPEYDEVLNG